jgi:hypothetical protein
MVPVQVADEDTHFPVGSSLRLEELALSPFAAIEQQ